MYSKVAANVREFSRGLLHVLRLVLRRKRERYRFHELPWHFGAQHSQHRPQLHEHADACEESGPARRSNLGSLELLDFRELVVDISSRLIVAASAGGKSSAFKMHSSPSNNTEHLGNVGQQLVHTSARTQSTYTNAPASRSIVHSTFQAAPSPPWKMHPWGPQIVWELSFCRREYQLV